MLKLDDDQSITLLRMRNACSGISALFHKRLENFESIPPDTAQFLAIEAIDVAFDHIHSLAVILDERIGDLEKPYTSMPLAKLVEKGCAMHHSALQRVTGSANATSKGVLGALAYLFEAIDLLSDVAVVGAGKEHLDVDREPRPHNRAEAPEGGGL
jgi:hypothetical protein